MEIIHGYIDFDGGIDSRQEKNSNSCLLGCLSHCPCLHYCIDCPGVCFIYLCFDCIVHCICPIDLKCYCFMNN